MLKQLTYVTLHNVEVDVDKETPADKLITAGFIPGHQRLCWYCGSRLRWNADFSFEEYGHEGEGIVSVWTCDSCDTDYEVAGPRNDT